MKIPIRHSICSRRYLDFLLNSEFFFRHYRNSWLILKPFAKLKIIIFHFIFVSSVYGQSEASIVQSFQNFYNSEKYESIYNMFSREMQQKNSKKAIGNMLKGLKSGIGELNSTTFIIKDEESFFHYKAIFEKATLDLAISSKKSKISGFKIVPFDEEAFTRKVVNGLVNFNNDINQEQRLLIFEFCKGLPNDTEIAIGLIQNRAPKFYGIRIENDTMTAKLNQKSVFEIGSISKVFTSTILSSYVKENKIKLSDYINKDFAFDFNNNTKITYLELANHSSGLARLPSNLDLNLVDKSNPYKDYDQVKLQSFLKNELSLKDSLVGTYSYSNLGAGLLGFSLEKRFNMNYEQLLQKQVLSKYKMFNTTTVRSKVKESLIRGLDSKGEKTSNWDMSVLVGAGGVLSNTEDITKFIQAHFLTKNKELQLTTEKTLVANDKMNIGLAWHLLESESGAEWIWHNGGTGGYTSSLAMDKASKNAVVILSNVSAMNPKMTIIDKLCFELLKTLE